MDPSTSHRQGGCLCGAARYEIDLQGSTTGSCHCRDCQKNSGSPFMIFTNVARTKIRWLAAPLGEARASTRAVRRFCRECGTPLTWEAHDEPDVCAISTASLDDPRGVVVDYELFVKARWPGIAPIPGAIQHQTSPSMT